MELKNVKIISHTIGHSWENPFLIHHRYTLQNIYTDGSVSTPYTNEFFDRKGLDCVAVIPYFIKNEKIYAGFLKAFRPPVYMRRFYNKCIEEEDYSFIYECVAGSLEEEDQGQQGLIRRAKAELHEETGYIAPESRFFSLGGSFFPSHGQSTEKIHLFAADISGLEQDIAQGDGSVNETLNKFVTYSLKDIQSMCLDGTIEDPKIEIGVNRLEYFL